MFDDDQETALLRKRLYDERAAHTKTAARLVAAEEWLHEVVDILYSYDEYGLSNDIREFLSGDCDSGDTGRERST